MCRYKKNRNPNYLSEGGMTQGQLIGRHCPQRPGNSEDGVQIALGIRGKNGLQNRSSIRRCRRCSPPPPSHPFSPLWWRCEGSGGGGGSPGVGR